jgi:HK97 family phage major capsid protein
MNPQKKFWKWVRSKTPVPENPNETTESRTLFLNGTIAEESWFDDDVTPALFRSDLENGTGDITVWVNSPGGDCFAAAQIYNMLRDYKGKINIAATKPAAAWIEEGQELTFGDATFDQVILDAHKLHVAIKVTEELLYDNAFNLENYIIDTFGKAIGNAEEDAFLNGDGKGKPTGIFAETGGGQTGVTISGTKLTADDVISLVYALKRPYRKNAVFILNDSTLSALRKLKDNNGAYIWQPSYTSGEPDRLLGYSVLTSAYAPALEAGKPAIAFGDFSYYNIGDRGTRSVQELRELFAGNGMIGYVAKERVDGKLVLPEAVQILKAGASA